MGFFETISALFHDISVLGALAVWPLHGAFMAILGLVTVGFENLESFITNLF